MVAVPHASSSVRVRGSIEPPTHYKYSSYICARTFSSLPQCSPGLGCSGEVSVPLVGMPALVDTTFSTTPLANYLDNCTSPYSITIIFEGQHIPFKGEHPATGEEICRLISNTFMVPIPFFYLICNSKKLTPCSLLLMVPSYALPLGSEVGPPKRNPTRITGGSNHPLPPKGLPQLGPLAED